jgi:hypothetical protein
MADARGKAAPAGAKLALHDGSSWEMSMPKSVCSIATRFRYLVIRHELLAAPAAMKEVCNAACCSRKFDMQEADASTDIGSWDKAL